MTNKIKELEYPFNLIYAIFEDEAEEIMQKADTISDFNASVEYVLYTLSDREIKILKNRFIDLMTLAEVGKNFGVTRDRIRQVEARALRKLRYPNRSKYLRYGISGVIENIKTDYYTKFADLEGKLIELCKLNEKAADEIIHDTEFRKKYESIGIEYMDLSVRSYNCLKRAGINNIKQLASLSYYELTHIRNLGRKCIDEIIEKLKDYGYDTQKFVKENDKMADNEIIKALEWCDQFENNIVFRGNGDEKCVQALQVLVVIKYALKEYNRQKATIEELRKGFTADADYFASEYDNNIKAEAIKEFVERLKENYCFTDRWGKIIPISTVDSLVKEMTEVSE